MMCLRLTARVDCHNICYMPNDQKMLNLAVFSMIPACKGCNTCHVSSQLALAVWRENQLTKRKNTFVRSQLKKRGPPPNPLHALLGAVELEDSIAIRRHHRQPAKFLTHNSRS